MYNWTQPQAPAQTHYHYEQETTTQLSQVEHLREARDLINQALDHLRDGGIEALDYAGVLLVAGLETARNRFAKLERAL